MNDNLKDISDKDLEKELEKRVENKCESWGNNFEKNINNWEKKLPVPLTAILDALCLIVFIYAIAWICSKFGWINNLPTFKTLTITFFIIFAISLIYRLFFKSKCKCNK